MSLKEILQIKNIEQRMCVLKYNSEKLLDKAELLDKSERGNELYLVKDIFSEPAYFLKYECPSTGRVYVSGIDPQFVKENQDADTCMAWKHNWSFKEYYKLKIES
ncbi:MAG: hypothetical protein H8D45_30395 [Bacteroidetes bacterium]|nr:hypothetical protein [Bacteroidota bacterium]